MRSNRNSSCRFRYRNSRPLFLMYAVILGLLATTALSRDASQINSRRDLASSGANRAVIPSLKQKMLHWWIGNGSQSMRQRIKHSTKNDTSRNKQRGSFLTSQRPTKERLFNWYGLEGEDPNQFLRCMILRNEFNHNIYGITNPFLKVWSWSKLQQEHHVCHATEGSTDSKQDNNGVQVDDCYNESSTARSDKLSAAILIGGSANVETSWWPSLQIAQENLKKQDSIKSSFGKWRIFKRRNKTRFGFATPNCSFRGQDWKILRYRKRVGRGRECYKKVRDAALDWEFQSADGSTGMINVPGTCPSNENPKLETIPTGLKRSYSVQRINNNGSDLNSCSSSLYRRLGSRRLVSFASKSIAEFLPSVLRRRIYSINPVMVVYDVVDQRASEGQTTYTSTAYATLKGHFLRGEERVTVALRDGSQYVDVEILSISRAGTSVFGKTLWPFIGKMQSKFFQQQLDHLSKPDL